MHSYNFKFICNIFKIISLYFKYNFILNVLVNVLNMRIISGKNGLVIIIYLKSLKLYL